MPLHCWANVAALVAALDVFNKQNKRCCLNIGTRIVTVRAVTERDEVEFPYSPDRYDGSSNIQTTMYY